jgi:hypothetical protein
VGRIVALTRAVAALEERGIPVALLREFEPDGRFVEVDLLVASGRDRDLSAALVSSGFARLRAWGHGDHRFYLCYSATDRLWLKLDFVTRVAGADTELALAGRRRNGSVPRLDPAVEGGLLLLHCVLDKQGRPGRHAAALQRLGAAGTAPPPGAPDRLRSLWPELERAVSLPGSVVPDALVRSAADVLAPDRARRRRQDRWLRRASYLRRVVRPAAATVVVIDPPLDDPDRWSRRLAEELGPGARWVSPPPAGGPLTRLRRRLIVELERRRSDGPLVIEAGPNRLGLGHADVTVTASSVPEQVPEAVWRAYRTRLVA